MCICINCSISFQKGKNSLGKYCSNTCQHEYEQSQRVEAWLRGECCGWSGKTRQLKPYIRRWLRSERGTACEKCGWDERHPIDGSVLTEIDHVDGNAENCRPENLRILCPNCHAMTPTFRARNKSSSRSRN